MSARSQLRALIAEHGDGPTEPMPRNAVFRSLDPVTARRAAVLVLFGAHSDVDLHEHSLPEELDLLFVQRAATLRDHAGQIAFPGGGIDPTDADAQAAALREAQEETGADPEGIEVLGRLRDAELPVSNFVVTPVIGWWSRPSEVHPVDPGESSAVFRVAVDQLLDPARRITTVVHHEAERFVSPGFDTGHGIVWGFTAIVLDRMFNELGWTRPWEPVREVVMR